MSQSGPPNDVTDARLVAATFRTVSDADGFDDMMEAWGRRLKVQLADGTLGELDQEMREHVELALAQFHNQEATAMANPVDEAMNINAPAMVLSPSGLVVAVNETGLTAFSALQGRSVGTDWLDPESAEDFGAVMQSAQQRGNRKQAIIRTFDGDGNSGLAEAYVIKAKQEHSNLVAIRSLDVQWSGGIDAILTEAFALTEAECAIARALFHTRDSREIARLRDTSVHTVRTQLRTIQAKTNAASQTDLVRLLTLLAHRKQDRRDDGVMGWRDPWGNQAYIDGPDGMRIGYSWTGAPEGKPVLIVPSIMHGYAMAEASEERLRDAGIKLWAIQRPGTCNSTAKSFSRETDMDAIKCMVETLELGPVVALGLSGTIDLVRSAIRDPNLYKAVILAGLSSPTTRAVRSLFPLTQVAMIGAARKSPLLGKLIIETAQRNARRKGMDWLAAVFSITPLLTKPCCAIQKYGRAAQCI